MPFNPYAPRPTIREFIDSREWAAPVAVEDVLRVAREQQLTVRYDRVAAPNILTHFVREDAAIRAAQDERCTNCGGGGYIETEESGASCTHCGGDGKEPAV